MDYDVFQILTRSHDVRELLFYCVKHKWVKGFGYVLWRERVARRLPNVAELITDAARIASNYHCYSIIKYLCEHPVYGNMTQIYTGMMANARCAVVDYRSLTERRIPTAVNRHTKHGDRLVNAMYEHVEMLRSRALYWPRVRSTKWLKYVIKRMDYARDEIIAHLRGCWPRSTPESLCYLMTHFDVHFDDLGFPTSINDITPAKNLAFKYLMTRKDFDIDSIMSYVWENDWLESFVDKCSVSDVVTLLAKIGTHNVARTVELITQIMSRATLTNNQKIFNYINGHKTYRKYVDWSEVSDLDSHQERCNPLYHRARKMENSSIVNDL